MKPTNIINFEIYKFYFEAIINKTYTAAPYDEEEYFHYVEMNWTRQNRWFKNTAIPAALTAKIEATQAFDWYLITEPWCGDAAHLVPLIKMMADCNPKIRLHIILRDENLEFMNAYLTDGSKSIPKLIIRNDADEDVAIWGPRPVALQKEVVEWKKENITLGDLKIALQKWYNNDKGNHTFEEFMNLGF